MKIKKATSTKMFVIKGNLNLKIIKIVQKQVNLTIKQSNQKNTELMYTALEES